MEEDGYPVKPDPKDYDLPDSLPGDVDPLMVDLYNVNITRYGAEMSEYLVERVIVDGGVDGVGEDIIEMLYPKIVLCHTLLSFKGMADMMEVAITIIAGLMNPGIIVRSGCQEYEDAEKLLAQVWSSRQEGGGEGVGLSEN